MFLFGLILTFKVDLSRLKLLKKEHTNLPEAEDQKAVNRETLTLHSRECRILRNKNKHEPRDYRIKQSQSGEREILSDISYVWNLNYDANEPI